MARVPYIAVRPVEAWITIPGLVVHSPAGQFQPRAAASTSISRATEPTRRKSSQLLGIAVEPPATCTP